MISLLLIPAAVVVIQDATQPPQPLSLIHI